MGKRYQAVLSHLGKKHSCFDTHYMMDMVIRDSLLVGNYTHVIIATPTHTHYDWLYFFHINAPNIKILCEKPIVKSSKQMIEIATWNLDLTMTFQYKYAARGRTAIGGASSYNHYNHGTDGLAWDCIQLIGLSTGSINLREDSPDWVMYLNDHEVDRNKVDQSYVLFVHAWIYNIEVQHIDDLVEIHNKTEQLNKKVLYDGKNHNLDWDPSTDKLNEATQ